MAAPDRAAPASESRSPSPRDAVLQVEGAVGAAIFATSAPAGERHVQAATAADAVHAAVASAREGDRAAAVLGRHELLGALDAIHQAARRRSPIVIHVVGGDDGAGPCVGRDEIAPVLDIGAGVLVAWSTQEAADLALAVRRAGEDAETPFVLVTDGGGPLMSLPAAGLADAFLGVSREARQEVYLGALEHKRRERGFAARAPFALAGAMRALGEMTGRPLGAVERYETADAEEIIVAVGQAYTAARRAAEGLRREGRRVGALGVRVLRPFFSGEILKAVSRGRAIAVIEPLDVALAPAGPLATSIKAAFADALTWAPGYPGVGHIPPIVSVVFATIDGIVTERDVRAAVAELTAGDRAKRSIVFGSDAV